jgi:putative nucleotidyltransferase with HDIG domain
VTGAPLEALAAIVGEGWLVGGAVRDDLLRRPTADFDVAVAGDARVFARELGRRCAGHAFSLSEEFGAWRVIARDRSWQVDLTPLLGETLEEDLGRRDLTVNAIARPLGAGRELIDPFGGRADLDARRLRMVGPMAFGADPLRVIRLARLAAELDFEIEDETAGAAGVAAPGLGEVSPERVFAELRLILAGDWAAAGLQAMESLGASAAVLPELVALHDVEQSDFHHLDVHDHTMAVLEHAIALERDPGQVFRDSGEEVARVLAEPLANDLTRGQALRFGALFHDIAKPRTRGLTPEGRVTFFGHDQAGADTAVEVLGRLRASERLSAHVAALARHHLRLGFLVHQMPLGRQAIYRYLRACEPVQVDVTVLSVADRLATQGRNGEPATALHLELARELMPEALRWRAQPPRPPVRGDRLAAGLGIRPGPEVGRLLEALTEAAYVGEVASEEEAVAWARAAGVGR